jgi:deoxycytidylate deaminase
VNQKKSNLQISSIVNKKDKLHKKKDKLHKKKNIGKLHKKKNIGKLHKKKDKLHKKKNIGNLCKFSLLVIRVNNNNKLMESKPCSNCINYIKSLGIKKIYYSTSDSNIKYNKINNLHSEHISVGFRKNFF